MKFQHKRGSRFCGNPVYLPYIDQEVRVNGAGIFEIPDDSPDKLIDFLLNHAGHTQIDKPAPQPQPEPEQEPVEVEQEEPVQSIEEPEPEPQKDTAPEWYPDELSNINGIGKKTAKKIGKLFPNPDVIIESDRPDELGRISMKAWSQVQDYIKNRGE